MMMPRIPIIDIFSPLPPLPTEIANHTVSVVQALAHLAKVRVWTDQPGPIELDLPGIEIHRFDPAALPSRKLNQADATFFNLGNNAKFHRGIHQAARRIPGIVILHDTRLQHFFAVYGEHAGPEREYYLDLLTRTHGRHARMLAEARMAGADCFDELVDYAPMTFAALDGAIGAIVHNAQARSVLQPQTHVPLYHVPLSCEFGPAPRRTPKPDPASPSRLVIFGFIGENRRLMPILQALASMSDRAHYRLDIYGHVTQEKQVDEAIATGGLEGIVTRHGFVPDTTLSVALAEADLALNLRWPTMGEASASQLRIWAAKLPALVTRVGWYAQLSRDAVFMIDPDQECDEIVYHLRALRQFPGQYVQAGENGRKILEMEHSPRRYAEALVAIAAEHAGQHSRRMGSDLAERCAKVMLDYTPADLARPLGAEVTTRIAEFTGSQGGSQRLE